MGGTVIDGAAALPTVAGRTAARNPYLLARAVVIGGSLYAVLNYSYSKPLRIFSGATSSTFTYGADLARYRQTTPQGTTILYLDKFMEIESSASNTDYRHYLSEVAILTKAGSLNDANPGIRYLLRDRLGSLATIADQNGISVESHGYDAFGKPRLGNWSDKAPVVHGSGITDRGFTAHEHLDDWQLIHMNGRAYDYHLGRFLSLDPIIQAPGNSQSMNPYSYIMNNPLSGTDPSGYCARATGSRICTDRDQLSSTLGNIDNFTEYQRQDGSTFWAATTNGGDLFKVQGFSNVPGSVLNVADGAQTDSINGLSAAAAGLSDQNVPDGTVTIGPIQISWNYRDNFFGRMLESGDAASIGVGLSPAGVLADLYTAGTGEDYFTKEEVPGWMRAAVLVPGVSELRKTSRVADAARAIGHGHHAIPRFLGGNASQVLSRLDPKIHGELHALLRENLRAAGIPLNIGGRGGSAADWARYMNANPGAQRQALDAVLDASRSIDARYGTSITQDVWQNVLNGNFMSFP